MDELTLQEPSELKFIICAFSFVFYTSTQIFTFKKKWGNVLSLHIIFSDNIIISTNVFLLK